jgi:hypothetical protein
MPDNENQSRKINGKWLAIGAGSLLCVMMLPSFFLFSKNSYRTNHSSSCSNSDESCFKNNV